MRFDKFVEQNVFFFSLAKVEPKYTNTYSREIHD